MIAMGLLFCRVVYVLYLLCNVPVRCIEFNSFCAAFDGSYLECSDSEAF